MNDTVAIPALTPQDFTSDQEVRWCPGCGDYAIIKAVRKALGDLVDVLRRSSAVSYSGNRLRPRD